MTLTDIQRLLADFAKTGSEPAFRELLTRYTDLVYSTAVRLVGGDTHLAKDVAQIVFIDLARKAPSLPKEVMLGGWLHHHTVFVAATMTRGERRRRLREKHAIEMNELPDHTKENLAELASVLDEAIDKLPVEDRTAILLRFFEQVDFRSLGDAIGGTEEAARKRVTRALDKLHSLLAHRGVTLSAAALGTALATEAVTAAPAVLAASLAGTALASTAAGGGTTLTLVKLMSITKVKLAVVSAVAVAAVAVPVVIQTQSAATLRKENQHLNEQVNQLAKTAADNERLSNLVAQANASRALPSDEVRELLRLRSEVGSLRQQNKEIAVLRDENRQLRTRAETVKTQLTQLAIQNQRVLSPDEEERNACINHLRQIDGAMQQFALENKLSAADYVTAEQIRPYLKEPDRVLHCPSGGRYSFGSLTNAPLCSIPGHVIPNAAETAHSSDEMIPAGSIKFTAVGVAEILAVYAAIARANMDIDPAVKGLSVLISFENKEDITRSEAIALLDKALRDQAGIIATHPNTNRAVFRLTAERSTR